MEFVWRLLPAEREIDLHTHGTKMIAPGSNRLFTKQQQLCATLNDGDALWIVRTLRNTKPIEPTLERGFPKRKKKVVL